MSVPDLIPDAELIVGDLLRASVDARVGGQVPKAFKNPWVRVVQLNALNLAPNRHDEFLVEFLLQIDSFAGDDPEGGQAQASQLARQVRFTLVNTIGRIIDGAVVSDVQIVNHARLPDADFDPPRERYALTARVVLHTGDLSEGVERDPQTIAAFFNR